MALPTLRQRSMAKLPSQRFLYHRIQFLNIQGSNHSSGKAFKIGDKRNFHIFSFDLLKPVKTELEVEGQDTLTYQSKEKQVYILRQTLDMMNGITQKVWLDTDGVSYRSEVPMMDFSMVTTKTDKEVAFGDTEEVDIVLKNAYSSLRQTPYAKRKKL